MEDKKKRKNRLYPNLKFITKTREYTKRKFSPVYKTRLVIKAKIVSREEKMKTASAKTTALPSFTSCGTIFSLIIIQAGRLALLTLS